MNIYLDDNCTDKSLAASLRKVGHTVFRPADFGLTGASDACHLERAIREGLEVLTKDRDDFHELHQLVLTAGGRHQGIMVVRYDNDATRNMKTGHVVKAIARIEHAGIALVNEWVILNQWR